MSSFKRSTAIVVSCLGLGCGALVYSLTGPSASAQPYRHNLRIHKALDALREAKLELQEAPHDYHGHRREALEAVNHAIERLEIIKDIER